MNVVYNVTDWKGESETCLHTSSLDQLDRSKAGFKQWFHRFAHSGSSQISIHGGRERRCSALTKLETGSLRSALRVSTTWETAAQLEDHQTLSSVPQQRGELAAMSLNATLQPTVLVLFPLTLPQTFCNVVAPSFPTIFVASSG